MKNPHRKNIVKNLSSGALLGGGREKGGQDRRGEHFRGDLQKKSLLSCARLFHFVPGGLHPRGERVDLRGRGGKGSNCTNCPAKRKKARLDGLRESLDYVMAAGGREQLADSR